MIRGTWNGELSRIGWHRFFTDDSDPEYLIERDGDRETLGLCTEAWRARLNAVPQDQHELPLKSAPIAVGYTKFAPQREREHLHGEGSTMAMQLLESISKYLNMRYRWKFYVVVHLNHYLQASVGEVFLSRIARSYNWLTGFNPVQAGESFASILNHYSVADTLEWYKEIEKEPFLTKYKLEKKFMHSNRDQFDRLRLLYEVDARIANKKASITEQEQKIRVGKESLQQEWQEFLPKIRNHRAWPLLDRTDWKLSVLEQGRGVIGAFEDLVCTIEDDQLRDEILRDWEGIKAEAQLRRGEQEEGDRDGDGEGGEVGGGEVED